MNQSEINFIKKYNNILYLLIKENVILTTKTGYHHLTFNHSRSFKGYVKATNYIFKLYLINSIEYKTLMSEHPTYKHLEYVDLLDKLKIKRKTRLETLYVSAI